ncbi:MAG TPA: DNA methyltransferase [archaeon]|nr:DNA methyltransferase [archaeon]
MQFEERLDLGEHATFVPSKSDTIYNWFYYKEGFSKQLVFWLIDKFGLKAGDTVLDTFCGSGNALLACRERGINSIGIDVLPAPLLAARVKTNSYDIEKLSEAKRSIFANRFQRPERIDVPKLMKIAFSKYAIEDIIFFKGIINRIDYPESEFFLLALINAAMRVSYTWKDGGVIKIRKRPAPPLRAMFKRTAERMIKDLKKIELQKCETTIIQGDARRIELDDESVDAIITSPPYLNNIDYTKVYEIENWIASGETKPALRSFIGIDDTETKEKYFTDMEKALKEMYRVLKPNGKVAIVVGNAFMGEKIDSDILLADIAEKTGFRCEKIIVLNKRAALINRTTKIDELRESCIILRK